VSPEGTIKLLGVATENEVSAVTVRMTGLTREFRKKGVFTTSSVLASDGLSSGVVAGLQSLGSAFFRPNVLFMELGPQDADGDIKELWRETQRLQVGLALMARHPRAGLGRRAVVHLWFPAELVTRPVADALDHGHMHLAVLVALRLHRAWRADVRFYALVDSPDSKAAAQAWLANLVDLARVPSAVRTEVMVGDLEACLAYAPQSDLDLMGLPADADLDFVRRSVELSGSACLFLGDSGQESALA
jgi:hypothetical protein